MLAEGPRRLVALGTLYAVPASLVLVLFLSWPGAYEGPVNLVDMVNGAAEKPYVGRLLLPGIVRLTSAAAERGWSAVGVGCGRRALERFGSFVLRRAHAPAHAFEHADVFGIYAAEALLCFIGFALALRAMLRSFYPLYPACVADLAPAVALVILPLAFFKYVSFVYDPMTLLAFGLGLYLVAMGIPLLLGCLLFGNLGEMRTYYELYPATLLLAVPSVVRALGRDVREGAMAGPNMKRV